MKSKIAFVAGLTGGVLVALSATLVAGQVTGLINFTAGTPAVAGEVNGNFNAVKTAVDDNDARIAALEAKLASMTVTTLNGQPTVQFSGVNVRIVNGQGATDSQNGRGNLIVGYDEPRDDTTFFCSIGTDLSDNPIPPSTSPTPPAACTAAGGTWAVSHKSGSHYLVVGERNNYSQSSAIVTGRFNTSNGRFADVTGGQLNTASAFGASVSGGIANTASGSAASVSGGGNNTARGPNSSVSGGGGNTASAFLASVSGGEGNTATGQSASVSGGGNNTASGNRASVSGGQGCNFGATNNKWVVGDSATPGCNATHQN